MRHSVLRGLLLVSVVLTLSATMLPAQDNVRGEPDAPPAGQTPAPSPEQPVAPGQEGDDTRTPARDGQQGWSNYLMPAALIGIMVLLFVSMGRKQRKEQARQRELLANLKKGDKVVTIGGVRGVLVEVREDEVTLKVDEASNTRIRFSRGAIARTLEEEKSQSPEKK